MTTKWVLKGHGHTVADFAEGGNLEYLHESLPLSLEEMEAKNEGIENEIRKNEESEETFFDESEIGKEG